MTKFEPVKRHVPGSRTGRRASAPQAAGTTHFANVRTGLERKYTLDRQRTAELQCECSTVYTASARPRRLNQQRR